jgi:carbamoyltransferase
MPPRVHAPAILHEAVPKCFEQDDDAPFMMQVFQIRPQKRSIAPAFCQVGGFGRLQTVHADKNPFTTS